MRFYLVSVQSQRVSSTWSREIGDGTGRLKADGNEHYDKALVTGILSRDAIDQDYLGFITYPNNGGAGEVFGLDHDVVDGLMFAHFGGPAFVARIFEVADRTKSLIIWTDGPEGPTMGVTQAELAAALVPPELEEMGSVAIIRDTDHLADLMGRHVLTPMRYIACG